MKVGQYKGMRIRWSRVIRCAMRGISRSLQLVLSMPFLSTVLFFKSNCSSEYSGSRLLLDEQWMCIARQAKLRSSALRKRHPVSQQL